MCKEQPCEQKPHCGLGQNISPAVNHQHNHQIKLLSTTMFNTNAFNTNAFIKKILSQIQYGTISVIFYNNKSQTSKSQTFGTNNKNEPHCTIEFKNRKAITSVINEGDIGLGRGYIEGWWKCNDITSLLIIFTQNIQAIETILYGNKFYNTIYRIFDFFKRNTIKNSKKNIEYHYDLGNEFYFKWLDSTKTYSSGIFHNNETLTESQKQKYQNILKHIPNAKTILEIGCGWGGFIQEAYFSNSEIKIKGITLSQEQLAFVSNKFKENPNIQPTIQDYRLEKNQYDAIVSIEMFEAVGIEYWNTYFEKIHECLNDNGTAVIQTITISETAFEKYKTTSDFIRHFIFPGGMLPTEKIFKDIANKCGLEVVSSENFGMSYYKTLVLWLEKFDSIKDDILSLNFDEKFIRKWRFYLAYCAAGFYSQRTDVFQFVLKKNPINNQSK